MQQIVYSQEILDELEEMHDLVVKGKYYFLKAIQFKSFSDDVKNELRERILEIADKINRHFTEVKYAKVSQYNLDEYEKNEKIFMKETRKEIDSLVKACKKRAPVKTKYVGILVDEKEIDGDILSSKIYGTRALEIDKLQNLNGFKEYLIENVAEEVEEESDEPTAESSSGSVDKELLKLKISSFADRLANRGAQNPEIFYKVKAKFENLIFEDHIYHVIDIKDATRAEKLNNDELYIQFDDLQNIILMYKVKNIFIQLDIHVIEKIENNRVWLKKDISCESQVSSTKVGAKIPFKIETDVIESEALSAVLNDLLIDLELEKIYQRAISLVEKYISKEKNEEKDRQREIVKNVSDGLDEIL